jgi:hypothetical protein
MPEKDLKKLLSSINPLMAPSEFVFCSITEERLVALDVTPLCLFRETEAVSVILEKSAADKNNLNYDGSWKLITCQVNSDLQAVGFLSAIAKAFSDADIPLNAVSAYFHDHLLVPSDQADHALQILNTLKSTVR